MAVFAAIAVLGTLILSFILFSKWRYTYWKRKGIPQLKPSLFFGDLKPALTGEVAIQVLFMNIYKNAKAKGYKQIGIYGFLEPQWIPLDLKIIKQVLLKDFEYFRSHAGYRHEKEPITRNLFSAEGDEWKKLRTKLSPTFTSGKMKMMFETLTEKTKILQRVVSKLAENHEVPIKETLARFGTDVIGSVAFGIEVNSLEEPNEKFRRIGKKIFQPVVWKFIIEEFLPHDLLGKLGYRKFENEISEYLTSTVQQTIEYRESSNIQRKDFIQLMLQLKNQDDKTMRVTVQEIINEAFLFFAAGFETSSSATSFALLELSQNQDIQDKLRAEIFDALEKNDGEITYDIIMQMPYLDKVMHEALRKYPPLPFIPRMCTKDYKEPETELIIEKGTRVFIPAWGIHMDPEFYPNPEVFNPENFSQENKAKRPDFTWMPFGEGPRICIGMRFGLMQSKMALTTLLRNFRFSPHEKTKWPLEMDEGAFVLTGKGEMWLRVEKL